MPEIGEKYNHYPALYIGIMFPIVFLLIFVKKIRL